MMPQMGDPLILCHWIISPGLAIRGFGVCLGISGLNVGRLGAGMLLFFAELSGEVAIGRVFAVTTERFDAFFIAADLVDVVETELLAVLSVRRADLAPRSSSPLVA